MVKGSPQGCRVAARSALDQSEHRCIVGGAGTARPRVRSGGGVAAAWAAFGVGERAEFAGAVVPDRVHPDDLVIDR